MNYSLAILWCIFLTLGTYLVFLIVSMWINAIKTQPQLIILPSASNQCGDVATLPNFSSLRECNNPGIQYRGTKWDPGHNFIVSPVQVNYLNVCETACGSSGLSTIGKCVDTSFQESYNKCVSFLVPTGCNSLANPVGKVGEVLYYANYVGEGLCFA